MKSLPALIPLLGSVMVAAGEPIVVAHRGASWDSPENTIPAFQLAWKQGADAIEGDFHLTRDGQIVCIHDRDTGKVAEKKLLVSASTLAELRGLDVGSHKGERFKGTRIPTLAEVFATVPVNKKIFVEVKCGKEIIRRLLEEIGKSGLQIGQIVVISFDGDVLKEVKENAPAFKVSWLCDFKRKEKGGPVSPTLESALDTLAGIKAEAISSSSSIPAEYIDAIKAQGYEWHVWTVNDGKAARRARSQGAASITTDVPERVRTSLRG